MTKLKKTLITAAGPNMLPLLEQYSLPTFKKYADIHGYAVHVEKISRDSLARKDKNAKDARWQKIRLLREALETHDIAVWIDADVLLCRYDEDVIDHVGLDDFQGFVLHSVPAEDRINPNTGVWVMRRSSMALEFLETLETIGMPSGRWADQGAILEALGWIKGDDRYHGARMPKEKSTYLQKTAWLPVGWNQPYCDNRPNPKAYIGRPVVEHPHALHFMAMTIEDRRTYMAEEAQKISRQHA